MNPNGITAIAVGAYLLIVVLRSKDNAAKLFALLKGEAGFVKWGVAVSLLWYIATRKELGELGAGLIFITVLGLAIKVANDPTILAGIQKSWAALPDVATK